MQIKNKLNNDFEIQITNRITFLDGHFVIKISIRKIYLHAGKRMQKRNKQYLS